MKKESTWPPAKPFHEMTDAGRKQYAQEWTARRRRRNVIMPGA